jgi:hypothetical protein
MTSGKSTVRTRNCNAYPQTGKIQQSFPPVRSSGLILSSVFTKGWKTRLHPIRRARIKLGTGDTSSRFPGLYTIPGRRPPLGAPVRCTCCIRRPSSIRRRLRTTHYIRSRRHGPPARSSLPCPRRPIGSGQRASACLIALATRKRSKAPSSQPATKQKKQRFLAHPKLGIRTYSVEYTGFRLSARARP